MRLVPCSNPSCKNRVKLSPCYDVGGRWPKKNPTCSRTCARVIMRAVNTGSGNPFFKGGEVIGDDGYIYVLKGGLSHHERKLFPQKKGRILKHRLVMSRHLGRALESYEEVHHVDGDKRHNVVSNLFLIDKKHHSREHFQLFMEVHRLRQAVIALRSQVKELGAVPIVSEPKSLLFETLCVTSLSSPRDASHDQPRLEDASVLPLSS